MSPTTPRKGIHLATIGSRTQQDGVFKLIGSSRAWIGLWSGSYSKCSKDKDQWVWVTLSPNPRPSPNSNPLNPLNPLTLRSGSPRAPSLTTSAGPLRTGAPPRAGRVITRQTVIRGWALGTVLSLTGLRPITSGKTPRGMRNWLLCAHTASLVSVCLVLKP